MQTRIFPRGSPCAGSITQPAGPSTEQARADRGAGHTGRPSDSVARILADKAEPARAASP